MYTHRLATYSDIDFLYDLYFHPDVNPWLLYDPMSKEDFEPVIKELIDQKVKYIFEKDNVIVGMFKLVPYRFRAAHAVYLGGLAIHPDFVGMGLGKAILHAILEIAKSKDWNRIELAVSVRNHKAIALYTKMGFEREGQLRNIVKFAADNSYMDEYLYAILL